MLTRHLARTAFTVHLAAILMGLAAHGAVYYVDGATGNDAFPGISWPLAKQSVAGALAVATGAGDEVWVKQGTYAGGITLNPGGALYGGFAGSETAREQRNWLLNTTILQGSGFGSVVSIPDDAPATTVLDGFTIQMGQAQDGGGIACEADSAPLIRGNTLAGNSAGARGGAIACLDSSPTVVSNVVIQGNAALRGGALACVGADARPEVRDQIVQQNTAYQRGGGIFADEGSRPVLLRCRLESNNASSGGGGACADGATLHLDRCTVRGNTTAPGSAGAGGGADAAPQPPQACAAAGVGNGDRTAVTGQGRPGQWRTARAPQPA